jgi:hypothetical protein
MDGFLYPQAILELKDNHTEEFAKLDSLAAVSWPAFPSKLDEEVGDRLV